MPYSAIYYLNDVIMTLSVAWEISNFFLHSEPAQISSTNLSSPVLKHFHMGLGVVSI